nr:peptidase S10, serine carboxypeptidase, alpha/beta hydrolase fold protein [Tanacetum cinerariifolium]
MKVIYSLLNAILHATRNDCNGDYAKSDSNNLRCMLDINDVNKRVGPINIQQILDPGCHPATNLVRDGNPVKRGNRRTLRADPINMLSIRSAIKDTFCRIDYYNYATMWANDADVMKALGVREGMVKEWLLCNLDIKYNYGKPSMPQYESNVKSIVAYHKRLTKRDCRALIFSTTSHQHRTLVLMSVGLNEMVPVAVGEGVGGDNHWALETSLGQGMVKVDMVAVVGTIIVVITIMVWTVGFGGSNRCGYAS